MYALYFFFLKKKNFLTFYLLRVCKSLTIIMNLSIFPCHFVNSSFIYCEAMLLVAYRFRIALILVNENLL